MATVRKKPGNKGEAHGSAKLTTWQVKDIFERADYEPHRNLLENIIFTRIRYQISGEAGDGSI